MPTTPEPEPIPEPPVPKPRPRARKPSNHTLCRMERSLFKGTDVEPVPFHALLRELTVQHLKTIETDYLRDLQKKVGEAVLGDNDARYIQFYVACLLNGVDFMDDCMLESDKAQDVVHRISLAVQTAKTQCAPNADVHVPLWAVIVAIAVLLVLVVLMIVFFSVVVAKVTPSTTPP
jgi:hypothetical protein